MTMANRTRIKRRLAVDAKTDSLALTDQITNPALDVVSTSPEQLLGQFMANGIC